MKMIKGTIVGAALVTILNPVAAQAGSPGCVSERPEWYSVGRGTMSQIEHEWDVVGAGHVVQTWQQGQQVLKQYPLCGVPDQTYGFVQVYYVRNVAGQYMSQSTTLWRLS